MAASYACWRSGTTAVDAIWQRTVVEHPDFPVHSRSALVVAHLLLDKGLIDQDELEAKVREVRARLEMT